VQNEAATVSALSRRRTAFLPDFCAVRMVIAVVLVGELLAIVLTLADSHPSRDHFQTLALNSLFIQWVALGCVAILCLLRSRLNRLADIWSALLSYLIMLLVTLVVTEIAWWLLHAMPAVRLGLPVEDERGHLLQRSLGISSIVSAVVLHYFYVQHQWQRYVRSEAEARLQALQARIRPHFLFNCMNTIASLTRREPALAEQAIEDLADLFRLSLQESQNRLTLAEEFDICRRYLRTEGLRLGERLRVEWQVDTLPEDACVPALLIQPLLENAVYHGIEPLPGGGCIAIRGERKGNRLSVIIENPLAPGATLHNHGNRLAQDNIRQRLAGVYGNQATLDIDSDGDRYQVRITFPYEREPCASS